MQILMRHCMECKKCKQYKEPFDFYANDSTCKECRKKMVRENRRKNIEYYREYDRARANRPDRVKARKEYQKTQKGINAGNKAKSAWAARNQIKRYAAYIVSNSLRDGKLEKGDACEMCQSTEKRVVGHHDDYAYPLSVRWLCDTCHRKWHKENGPGLNG